jgi:hypothetical protein
VTETKARAGAVLAGALAACLVTAASAFGSAAFDVAIPGMSGDQVVPGPGDPDAVSTDCFTGVSSELEAVKPYKGQLKVDICWSAERFCENGECVCNSPIGIPFAAHIHKGKAGEAGPAVLTLFEGELPNYPQEHCGELPGTKLKGLVEKLLIRFGKKPGNFYVDIHTDEFPEGAIRGQLAADTDHPFDPDQYEKK